MRKSMTLAVSSAAAIGVALTPSVAIAATNSSTAARSAHASPAPTSPAPTSPAPSSPAPSSPAPGSAAPASPASSPVAGNSQASGDPDTTVTFTVTSGLLTMSAPGSVTLDTGSGLPGTTISGIMTAVTVTDDRALLAPSWTVDASQADFSGTESVTSTTVTIPGSAETYDPGSITDANITAAAASAPPIALSNGATAVVTAGTPGTGDNTASWTPTLAVAIPAQAVTAAYSGTLTESVS